ncbi:hypothetical protein ACFZCG_39815 [Streptomyces tanashiensis]|uniref:hypothetical protein n=1 Tax=Streptomyces tanashiensis TaxID=67367 RepID=UPI0036EE848D
MPARLRGQIEEVRQAARNPWQLPHSPEDLFAMGANGLDLPERGRIPIGIIEAWKQQNPS